MNLLNIKANRLKIILFFILIILVSVNTYIVGNIFFRPNTSNKETGIYVFNYSRKDISINNKLIKPFSYASFKESNINFEAQAFVAKDGNLSAYVVSDLDNFGTCWAMVNITSTTKVEYLTLYKTTSVSTKIPKGYKLLDSRETRQELPLFGVFPVSCGLDQPELQKELMHWFKLRY